MKKKLCLISIALLMLLLCACNPNEINTSQNLKHGAYCPTKIVYTNLVTHEVFEKTIDEIINDADLFAEWSNIFNFFVGIDEKTEFYYTDNNQCFVLNESLAFEIIAENTLKLHFPYWQCSDNSNYDLTVILTYSISYQ